MKPTHLRYNLGFNQGYGFPDQSATLRLNRTSRILPDDASNWEAIIERYSIPISNSIPLMVCPVQLGQSDVNLTPFQITLQTGGLRASNWIRWVPQVTTAPTPAAPLQTQDVGSQYYYLWSYQWFIDKCINPCLSQCVSDLVSQGATIPEAPWFELDTSTLTFSLNGREDIYEDSQGYVRIFGNEAFQTLMPNFHYRISNDPVLTYQYMITTNPRDSNVYDTSYVFQAQEFPTISWSPLDSIVLTTQSIPVVAEAYTVNNPAQPNSRLAQTSASNTQISIISDMQVSSTVGFEYKQGVLTYLPSSEYRVVSLHSKGAFQELDVTFQWKDRSGNYYPITIAPGGAPSLKLLFRRRTDAPPQV